MREGSLRIRAQGANCCVWASPNCLAATEAAWKWSGEGYAREFQEQREEEVRG